MKSWLWVVVAASGCSRSQAPVVADAGAAVVDAGVAIHRSTDLRTAVFTSYPEFRGAQVIEGRATLRRTLDRPVPIEGEVLETVKKNGFETSLDGGVLVATRKPFTLKIEGPTLAVSLPIADGDVGKLLNSPIAMTTEQLGLWLPRPAGAAIAAERFELELRYQASASRAQFLAWQMVDLNTHGSWRVAQWPEGWEKERRPDGGGGGTPEAYSLTLVDSSTDARIELHRDGGVVELVYWLETEEKPR